MNGFIVGTLLWLTSATTLAPVAPEHNRLEKLYLSHATADSGNYDGESLTILMLFARHAQHNPESRIASYLAADLVPIFKLDATRFVQRMSEVPSVAQAVCNRLAAHFQAFPDSQMRAKRFLEDYREVFRNGLDAEVFTACARQFE